MPPPTPVPQKTPRNERSPRPAPNRRSASTATVTSLPSATGTPELFGDRRPERERLVQPGDVRDLDRPMPVAASMLPGAPIPTDSSSIGVDPGRRGGVAHRPDEIADDRLRPTSRGVLRRACPTTRAPRAVTTAWIFVPPRSSPPLMAAGAHVVERAAGWRARSIRRQTATTRSRGRAG